MDDLCIEAGVQRWEEKAAQSKWQQTRNILQSPFPKPAKHFLQGVGQRPVLTKRHGRPKDGWSTTFQKLLGDGWENQSYSRSDWDEWSRLSLESVVKAMPLLT